MPLRADELERLHGQELGRPPLSEATSSRLLYRALQERRLRIDASEQAVETWWGKCRSVLGWRVHRAEELQD